jgi:uncharacterized delta-60 repeat protein
MLLRVFKRGIAISALVVAFAPLAASSGGLKPGSLDPSFGRSGIVMTPIGLSAFAEDVVLQPDGKVIAVGLAMDRSDRAVFALTRHEPDGSLDPSFGRDGIVMTDVDGRGAGASAAALLPGHKIVVVGGALTETTSGFALAEYGPDGKLEPSFGENGVVTTTIGRSSGAHDVAIQPDGKIVAAGSTFTGTTVDFAIARYEPDGSLDKTFGTEGIVTSNVGGIDSIWGLALQPDGKIVAAGSKLGERMGGVFVIARYNRDGSPDSSFGKGGVVTSSVDSAYAGAYDVVIQPDGKIIAAGYNYDFGLVRLNPNGSADASFGEDGIVTTTFADGSSASAVALQPDGKVLAAGGTDEDGRVKIAIARYRRDGKLDRFFGREGKVRTALVSGWNGSASSLGIERGGKIVVAGGARETSTTSFLLARYVGGTLKCVVPKVIGKKAGPAKRKIRRAYCFVGLVKKSFSHRVPKGRVISQRPRAHTKHPAGTKVKLVISKGKQP